MQTYDIYKVEEYQKDRQVKAKFYNVGTAFRTQKGDDFNIELAPDMMVSGRLFMQLRKAGQGGQVEPQHDADGVVQG